MFKLHMFRQRSESINILRTESHNRIRSSSTVFSDEAIEDPMHVIDMIESYLYHYLLVQFSPVTPLVATY